MIPIDRHLNHIPTDFLNDNHGYIATHSEAMLALINDINSNAPDRGLCGTFFFDGYLEQNHFNSMSEMELKINLAMCAEYILRHKDMCCAFMFSGKSGDEFVTQVFPRDTLSGLILITQDFLDVSSLCKILNEDGLAKFLYPQIIKPFPYFSMAQGYQVLVDAMRNRQEQG